MPGLSLQTSAPSTAVSRMVPPAALPSAQNITSVNTFERVSAKRTRSSAAGTNQNVEVSGRTLARQIATLVDKSNFEFDDLGSEGGSKLMSFYMPRGRGHTHNNDGMQAAGAVLTRLVAADVRSGLIENHVLADIGEAGGLEMYSSKSAVVIDEDDNMSVLDRLVDLNANCENGGMLSQAVDLMKQHLTDIRVFIFGPEEIVLLPVVIAGTASDGSVVGLRSYVTYT